VAKIKYVGKKPYKEDNVAGTGIIWAGPGDVQEVTNEKAIEKFLEHKDVWQLVPDSTPVVAQSTATPPAPPRGQYEDEEVELPPVIDFNRVGKDRIDQYCRTHLGTKIDQRKPIASIRQQAWAAYGKHMASVRTAGLRK
jgi:hypothetical protein